MLCLVDTHCHLDADEFESDRYLVAQEARAKSVQCIIIPAVKPSHFQAIQDLAQTIQGGYALGIHPLFVEQAEDKDLEVLRLALIQATTDPRLVAIGEIGLDFFVNSIAVGQARARQEHFFIAQLKLAMEFNYPILLHSRGAHDVVLKYLRQFPKIRGIAHAFNGSAQQAKIFIQQGFVLGLGGAMTFERALKLRQHASHISLEHLVLESDAPNMAPVWLHNCSRRNTPAQVLGIAQILADLRQIKLDEVAVQTTANAQRVLPKLSFLMEV